MGILALRTWGKGFASNVPLLHLSLELIACPADGKGEQVKGCTEPRARGLCMGSLLMEARGLPCWLAGLGSES